MLRLYSVAANTFTETIRQPIYGVILLATVILLILNVSLAAFTLDDDNKLLLDLGLSTLLLSGLFLAAFSAAGVLSREIDNKTVLTVVSKPISRPTFLLGKFLGLIAALAVQFYLNTLVFILTVRHGVLDYSSKPWDSPVLTFGIGATLCALVIGACCNYFYGFDFPGTVVAIFSPLLTFAVLLVGKFGKEWEVIPWGSQYIGGQVLIAAFLVWLVVVVMTSVAVAASTRCGQMATLLICTVVLGLGIVSDYALGRHEATSTLALGVYRLLPNVGPFWVIDGLHAGKDQTAIPLAYVGYATSYALLLTSGILGLAVAAFQRREVG